MPEINLLQTQPQTPSTDTIIDSGTTITDSRSYVNNFSDLIGIRLVQRMPADSEPNDVGWRMARMSWREWREIERTQAAGKPTRWARNGYRFAVDPSPDTTYELKVDYRCRPPNDMIEVEGEWQEHMLCLAESIGWRAFGQPDLAVAALNLLPGNVANILKTPLDYAEWDALWDDDLSLQPPMG